MNQTLFMGLCIIGSVFNPVHFRTSLKISRHENIITNNLYISEENIKFISYAKIWVLQTWKNSSEIFRSLIILQQNLTIKVQDVNEPVSSITVTWADVNGLSETTSIGKTLGRVAVADPDRSDKISCKVMGGPISLKCREKLLCRSFDVVLKEALDFEVSGENIDVTLDCSDGQSNKTQVNWNFVIF